MNDNTAGGTSEGLSEPTLARIQAATGLVFGSFLVLHLANTALAALGQATYDGFQHAVRHFYQFPVVEVVVLSAGLLHLAAGLLRAWRRRQRSRQGSAKTAPAAPTAASWRVRLHRYSGYYLVVFFVGHVIATRGPALLAHEPADFSYLTFSLTTWPWFFYPYYIGLVLSGLYHLVHGTLVALRLFRVGLPPSSTAPRSRPFWAAVGIGGVAMLVGVLALGGNLFPVDTHRFPAFRALYDRVFPRALRPWAVARSSDP